MESLHLYSVRAEATILEAIEAIEVNRARTAVLVDGDKAVAVVSEGDIMRALLRGVDVHAPVLEIAQLNFRHLAERDLPTALDVMREHGMTLLPVVTDDMRLVDVVSWKDLLASVELP